MRRLCRRRDWTDCTFKATAGAAAKADAAEATGVAVDARRAADLSREENEKVDDVAAAAPAVPVPAEIALPVTVALPNEAGAAPKTGAAVLAAPNVNADPNDFAELAEE